MIPAPASAVPSPTEIGPYRILPPPLGQGGMGVVYRAEHRQTRERVALKTVRVSFPSEVASIRAEIHALTRLRHPGVVRIIGGGVTDGRPWYTMELLEGRTMADYLREVWRPFREAITTRVALGGPIEASELEAATAQTLSHEEVVAQTVESFPDGPLQTRAAHVAQSGPPRVNERWPVAGGHLAEALTLVRRLCDPLAFLHATGMVHRDLKPGNVFIRPDGMPVLMDFGLVSRFRSGLNRERLEVAGQVMGTAAYIAPEQVRGLFVDARADLYALGCMLYELLTGRVPFTAPTTVEVLYQHLDTPPERVSAFVDGVPTELDDLVARLLAKRSADRIGYAEDVATALERLGAQPPIGPRPPIPRSYLYRPDMQGRGEVVADLAHRFDGVREKRGGISLIGGESGVGKTFLAAEAARQAGGRKMRVVVGECLPVAVSDASAVGVKEAPLHPLRNLLLTIADVCREKGRAYTDRVLGRRGRVLAAYEPSLIGLAGQEAQPEPPELPAEAARRRLFDDLRATLSEFSHEQPLLFVLDDLQWADELTLAFLRDLPGEFFTEQSIYLLATYRTDEVKGEAGVDLDALRNRPHVHRIDLGRLDERTVGAIAGGMLAMSRPPEAFVRALARLTEGNPFFVAEYLRAAVDDGLLVREGGQWRVSDAGAPGVSGSGTEAAWGALELPRSLRALVARRLQGLTPTAMRLAEAAAVLGRESDLALLVAVSGVDESEALDTMQELRTRQVLAPSEAGDFRFVHDKLREMAHANLLEDQRIAKHRAAAAAIEARLARGEGPPVPPSILAHHFRESDNWPKAIEYLEKAAHEALAAFSNRDAQRFVKDALLLADRLPAPGLGPLRLGRLEGMLVEAHWRMGEHNEGRVHAERALAYFERPMPRTRGGFILGMLGQILVRMLPWALWHLRRPRTPLKRQLTVEAANVFNRMFDALLWNNEALPGFYCGLRGVNLADTVEPGKALARGLALFSVVVFSSPLKKIARRWATRSIALAEALGDPTTLSYCLGRISGIALAEGRFADAMAQLGRAHEVARETRNHRAIEECQVLGGSYRYIEGDFQGSLADYRQMRASSAERGDGQTQSWGRSGMAQALVRLGREEEALGHLDEDDQWLKKSGQRLEVCWAAAVRAQARLQLGDLDAARQSADTAFEWLQREQVVGYMWHPIVAALVEVYLALWQARGDAGPAIAGQLGALASKSIAVLAGFTKMYPFAVPSLHLARARRALILGRTSEAKVARVAGLAGAEQMKLRFEQAQAHLLGAALGEGDGPSQLARAEALFSELGANRELLRLRQERERPGAL